MVHRAGGQRHLAKVVKFRRRARRRTTRLPSFLSLGLAASIGAAMGVGYFSSQGASDASTVAGQIICTSPVVVDGDTFRCNGERIRLASIDAPEMPGHCRAGRRCTPGDPYAAREYLRGMARGEVQCRRVDTDSYGRTVALCEAGGLDLSCAMVSAGHAVERYGRLACRR